LVPFSLVAVLRWLGTKVGGFFGANGEIAKAGRWVRLGLGVSGGLLILAGLWLLTFEPTFLWTITLSIGLLLFGLYNMVSALRRKLSVGWANGLSLVGHFVAVFSFYIVLSRIVTVGYTTDTIVGTYMGVLKVLQLQSPYSFSIKPLMDSLGFSSSYYTPGVNGAFDFHLAYPSLSFLSLVPFYLAGMHDLRDAVFLFHIVSVLLIFGLAPPRLKSVSMVPFGLFPFLIAGSWTDSVWAFFLVLTAILWYQRPKASWVTLGLSVAVKQVAVVIAPFLLIRLWHERTESRPRSLGTAFGLMVIGFLVPNLPFMIASPSAWWADIVAPYLPNSPAQVPGGVGLSNILLDLGIALPSSFYLVTMLGASSLLLYSYARHYRGLNSLVFAFPVLIFFFYYRSFPNYMLYWMFPLALDICLLGGPNIRLFLATGLARLSWRPSTLTMLRPLGKRLTPSLVMLLVLTTSIAGVSGAYVSQVATPKLQIQVNSTADPDSIGAATLINVTLTNLLFTSVHPNFFAKFSPLPYYWTYNSTGDLSGRSERAYLISAPDAYSAIPAGDTFHVIVYDNLTDQLLGESSASLANIPIPRVVNPGLKWWVLDQSIARKAPFGWKFTMANVDSKTSGIGPLGVNGTGGVAFTLNYTSAGGPLQQIVMWQRLLFNSTKIGLGLNQALNTDPTTKSMLLASITDGTHAIYYILSSKTSQQITTRYSTNVTVIVPITVSQWTIITLDPQSLWNFQSWGMPQLVKLTVTLQTATSGLYYASVSEIMPISR